MRGKKAKEIRRLIRQITGVNPLDRGLSVLYKGAKRRYYGK
jgi:hypothetical protein